MKQLKTTLSIPHYGCVSLHEIPKAIKSSPTFPHELHLFVQPNYVQSKSNYITTCGLRSTWFHHLTLKGTQHNMLGIGKKRKRRFIIAGVRRRTRCGRSCEGRSRLVTRRGRHAGNWKCQDLFIAAIKSSSGHGARPSYVSSRSTRVETATAKFTCRCRISRAARTGLSQLSFSSSPPAWKRFVLAKGRGVPELVHRARTFISSRTRGTFDDYEISLGETSSS